MIAAPSAMPANALSSQRPDRRPRRAWTQPATPVDNASKTVGPGSRSKASTPAAAATAAMATSAACSRLAMAATTGRLCARRSETRSVVCLGQLAQVNGQVASRGEGVGVVIAKDPAAPVQGVLIKVTSGLDVPERAQVGRQVASRGEGVGVVFAHDPAAPVQRVLVKVTSGLDVPELAQ